MLLFDRTVWTVPREKYRGREAGRQTETKRHGETGRQRVVEIYLAVTN